MRTTASLLLLLPLLAACGDESYDASPERRSDAGTAPGPGIRDLGSAPPVSDASTAAPTDAGVAASDAGGASSDAGMVTSDAGATQADAGPVDIGAEPQTEVNPFVRTAHDPFSTFAADVDSASYDIFVKSLREQRRLPAPPLVRSEEFVNYFTYDYPSPARTSTHAFAIDVEAAPTPGAETLTVRIGVKGRDLLADRGAANLVFLVDVSGSMSQADKLPVARELMRLALDYLRPDDTIAIVTYSREIQVALAPTPVSQRADIERVVDALNASGGTAGHDGLQMAYDTAQLRFRQGGINHILLLTDGDFNLGPYTDAQMLALVERRRDEGVSFTALGFGLGNLNDSMMELISNAGNGIYRVISGAKTARRYVEQRLLSDVVHIAKDVKLQVEMNSDRVYAWRQIGYENRQLADVDFRDDTVDAGEIGSGHEMTALYELALLPEEVPLVAHGPTVEDGPPVAGRREIDPQELVQVRLRYKAPGSGPADLADEMKAGLLSSEVSTRLSEGGRFAWAVATLAGRLRTDPYQTPARLMGASMVFGTMSSTAAPERREMAQQFADVMQLLP